KRLLEDKVVVLCASDVNQRSWPSAQMGLTVFTDNLMKGLQGAADANGDRRVTALELADYLKKNVSLQVKAAHHQAEQTPILLPDSEEGRKRARDIELTLVRETERASPSPAALSAETLKSLRKEWETWDERRKQVPFPA